jgi:hypothetical protein
MMTGMTGITAGRGTRLGFRVASSALALVVVAVGVFAVWYREAYSVWPGLGSPARVHWCGRDYQIDGPPQTWSQVTSQARLPIHAVGQYPPLGLWRQELLAVTPGVVLHGPGEPCAEVVYLRTGSGNYQGYTLEGGP